MIQAAVKSISDKPLRFVINTHYHDDHVGENAYFQQFAPIIASTNLRKRMENGGVAGNGTTQPPAQALRVKALPLITFDHDLTLHLHGEDIHVVHFPAAHTDGDAIVFFPKSNVVHMGDIFVTYGFPSIDVDAGGSVDGMIDAVEKVIAQVPADVKVIPGHGPVSTLDDVRAYLTMLKETRGAVRKAIGQGQTLEQMQQVKLLDPWKGRSRLISPDNFVKTLYRSLTKK
jgi:glyoxylase-like metal-dependent hydrolase (beta-lactamase superfamily II)